MRIVRFLDDAGQLTLGLDQGDGSAEVLSGELFGSLQPTGRRTAIARRLAPLEPRNIFCIGLNYREHALESGSPIPDNPVVFMKPTTALNHPGGVVQLPRCCTHGPEVDYECELAVVIGQAPAGSVAKDIPESRALEYVFGYTGANDISARRWQKQGGGGQWIRGKSFDTFCPLGPVLVTRDEIPDPQTLRVSTTLNGQRMQDHTTADMIFNVAKLISFISMDTTLLPGTVILTGTPQGVGVARKPPVFLKPGDHVVVEVERIGKLENTVA